MGLEIRKELEMEVRQEILDMSIKELEEKVFLDLTDKGMDEATARKTIQIGRAHV